jgi:hypothetical protein
MGNDDDRYDDQDHDLRWLRGFPALTSYEESEEGRKSREFIHGGRW